MNHLGDDNSGAAYYYAPPPPAQQHQQQQQQQFSPQPQPLYAQQQQYPAQYPAQPAPPQQQQHVAFPEAPPSVAGSQYAAPYSPHTYEETEASFSTGLGSHANANGARRESEITIPSYGMNAYPPAQGAPLRRRGTVKNVVLKGGKLVLDIPVPDKVLSLGKHRDGPEFQHMRYTAVTADPDDYVKEGYSLRAAQYGRRTELFVMMTMYNEDETLFAKTMTAVQKNIAFLCSKQNSTNWGPDGWKKVVVCVVSDGRAKVNERVKLSLGLMGCFQDGIMKRTVNGKEVGAHVFEYTTQINVDSELRIRGADAGFVPVQVIFCLKEKNAKKINSHRWGFNSFCRVLNPNVCILLDVGTKPSGTSLYHLWKAFDRNPNLGGACGEIYSEVGKGCHKLLNPLVAAQNFEYKMSNILDKPLESVFGYISVLPGAFSAYRYAALRDSSPGVGPLSSYFLGEKMHGGANIYAANMFLAEDRILCFELVTKRKERWILKYVKSAKAETDVPDAVPEFISQRRRWLNGSFFANVHALLHFWQIFRSSHSIFRKAALLFEFLYSFINLVFSWFGLSTFYLVFFFLGETLICDTNDATCTTDPFTFNGQRYGAIVFQVLRWLYVLAIIIIFLISLGNRPQGSKWTYTGLMVLFALIMGMMVFMSGYTIAIVIQRNVADGFVISDLWAEPAFRDIIISVLATYGLYLISSFLYFEPFHMFTAIIQYFLLLPSFVNILQTYGFCNLHDVSWGTKGDNSGAEKLGKVTTTQNADGAQMAQIELLDNQQDINAEYDRMLLQLRAKQVKAPKAVDENQVREDYFRSFRTRVLIAWVITNLALIAGLTNPATLAYFEKQGQALGVVSYNPYLTFIFFSVVVLAAIRFLGSTWYLIDRMIWG